MSTHPILDRLIKAEQDRAQAEALERIRQEKEAQDKARMDFILDLVRDMGADLSDELRPEIDMTGLAPHATITLHGGELRVCIAKSSTTDDDGNDTWVIWRKNRADFAARHSTRYVPIAKGDNPELRRAIARCAAGLD